MRTETRGPLEFERYLEYQHQQRPHRIKTLGGAATALVLATVDMGLSDVRDPASETHRTGPDGFEQAAEVVQLRTLRQRRLADFATDSLELGYARAA